MNKTTESVRKDLEGGDVGEDITGSDGNVASEILKKLDANSYATKKTIAQGLLDVALLTANASQLKYILQVGEQHEFYHLMLGLIITSIILQVTAAVLSIMIGTINVWNDHKHNLIAGYMNHVALGFVTSALFCDVIKMNFGLDPAVAVNATNLTNNKN
ncbi:ninjurin-2 isoform X4 [Onthophagus taurus]|uniref:ninjurin-2 isoform X4 n=1 Tax=Onthophagus taurus TaxID=166361 RepID=UPI000C201744|nr:ninjurin-2-like isoform X3 [Onthophagus taurus]